MNSVKLPGSEDTVREPPWAQAIRRAIGSPSPVPFFLYVMKGSKIVSICSLQIPHPLSLTIIYS